MSSAPDLSPREAVERWLDRQRVDKREQTVSAYWYRLKHFVEWCEENDVETVGELDAWNVETYETYRRGKELAPITLEKELGTLKSFFEYISRFDPVTDALPEWVEPPSAERHEQVSDKRLAADRARSLLATYRDGGEGQYTREHVFLELAWYTCARLGGLRGLDVDDVDLQAGIVRFKHRPDTGTPLKKGIETERPVRIPRPVATAIGHYRRRRRRDVVDDHGRRPLFTTERGRISLTSLRAVSYYATVPCRHTECPHGNDQETCEYWGRRASSGCPSSRSPHQVRTGAITWHRTRGVPVETVAEKAGTSPGTIRLHYDVPSEEDLMSRQDPHLDKLTFDDGNDSE
jgi:site-specific recombinase XerD